MVEQKLYKTKLCLLYQKGRCNRPNCMYAHGDNELRGSFNGRRYHGGGDLRDTIERRRSPVRRCSPVRRRSSEKRYSPRRDGRDRSQHYGYNPSGSLERNRRQGKNYQLDGQGDFSGSPKMSQRLEDVRERNVTSTSSKDTVMDQLKQVQSDIDMMDQQRCQLEINLEERVQEVNNLTSHIKELEALLFQENDAVKRITANLKKFLKAQDRHSHIQEELKRSQTQLERLGEQLGSDFSNSGLDEDDLTDNFASGKESNGNRLGQLNVLDISVPPSNKRPRIYLNTTEELTPGVNLPNEDRYRIETIRSKKPSQWKVDPAQIYDKKVDRTMLNDQDGAKPQLKEAKRKRVKDVSTKRCSSDKMKISEFGLVLPSTSMAAHAVDEVAETNEEENAKMVGNVSEEIEKGPILDFNGLPLPLPPPPPIPPSPSSVNVYSQFNADDANVDVVGYLEEMVDVV